MKCKECDCCHLGYFKSKPDKYVCTGVKEPFIINDIDVECTEYEIRRNLVIDEFTDVEFVSIPKTEYEMLLEYKHMYDGLCK